ncbi:trehalose-phosphatase [Caulobacter sp. NIBR2454]|uniref:trehalose-phosphatase n=1 Tax=Caulobacter sp. NIBR2454 TaxID=3015996 RepID=UPI0022B639FC|nr:trehalose-phosphatase [Caulobacter sp. NIBR2454]
MNNNHPTPLDLSRTALFLDLDGTLAHFEPKPTDVGPNLYRNDLLRRLSERLDGRLAVVSGRAMADLDRILEDCTPCLAGTHGLEIRHGDETHLAEPHPALSDAIEAFEAFARTQSGLLVEPKALGVALHYRLAPETRDACVDLAERVSAAYGLTLQDGHLVVELRTPGATKGDAVSAFMARNPFLGATPVFVGDDLTDEDGFREAVEQGGYGVLVGEERPTRATFRLSGPDTVLRWLESSLGEQRGAAA